MYDRQITLVSRGERIPFLIELKRGIFILLFGGPRRGSLCKSRDVTSKQNVAQFESSPSYMDADEKCKGATDGSWFEVFEEVESLMVVSIVGESWLPPRSFVIIIIIIVYTY